MCVYGPELEFMSIGFSHRRCKHWDTSATEYVKLLSSKKPLAEFTPIRFSPEGKIVFVFLASFPASSQVITLLEGEDFF